MAEVETVEKNVALFALRHVCRVLENIKDKLIYAGMNEYRDTAQKLHKDAVRLLNDLEIYGRQTDGEKR